MTTRRSTNTPSPADLAHTFYALKDVVASGDAERAGAARMHGE